MKRILVIRGGAIGDFVLTLPAIRLLRERWPNARLEILGYKHIVALADGRFYADATRSIEYSALASFFAKNAELPNDLADHFASFDLVISYLFDPDGIFERNLRRCGLEMILMCNPKITGDMHAARQLAAPLAELDLHLTDAVAVLFPSQADVAAARELIRGDTTKLVALHPGSGSATKNVELEVLRQVGDQLLHSGTASAFLVVGGEADGERLNHLRASWHGRAVTFVENRPLPHLAAVLQECALFLGHDSGISHIAAAVSTRCVLLFGPTDPGVWAPANANVTVLRGAAQLSADEIAAAATAALAET